MVAMSHILVATPIPLIEDRLLTCHVCYSCSCCWQRFMPGCSLAASWFSLDCAIPCHLFLPSSVRDHAQKLCIHPYIEVKLHPGQFCLLDHR